MLFNVLGRRGVKRRDSADRRREKGPVTIGFEQLEGRDLLSSGIALTIIPSRLPPLASMPRPIVGSVNPEAEGEGAAVRPFRVIMEPEPDRRWTRPGSLGGRFRLGPWDEA
jgi:hypothetical protein